MHEGTFENIVLRTFFFGLRSRWAGPFSLVKLWLEYQGTSVESCEIFCQEGGGDASPPRPYAPEYWGKGPWEWDPNGTFSIRNAYLY